MEEILVSYRIDKARYHGGTLEGVSIQKLLQKANKIFTDFKDKITKIIIEKNILKIVDEEVSRYIEIFLLYFILFFFLWRTPCGKMND